METPFMIELCDILNYSLSAEEEFILKTEATIKHWGRRQTNDSKIMLNVNNWIGVGKSKPEEYITKTCLGYILILAIVTLYSILKKQSTNSAHQLGWSGESMIKDKVYLESNKNLSFYAKFLLKYGFYNYGEELTYIFVALLIRYRSDVWAMVYSFWLVIFVLVTTSPFLPAIWNLFKYFLVMAIPLQYIAVLGLFPESCYGYNLKPRTLLRESFDWLFLPMGIWEPDTMILFWDSIVFLFALYEADVIEFERNYGEVRIAKISTAPRIFLDTDPMVYRKTTFGLVRYVIFWSLPNMATAWFFLAATDKINIYGLFYGICFALILWNIDSYFTTTSGRPRRLWKRLLMANVLIIFLKTCTQIPGCILRKYIFDSKYKWIRTLFGICCLKLKEDTKNQHYFLTWDILCFVTMLFHDRFLRSPFYIGMAIEAELTKKFSFKAAKILKELHERELATTRERYEKNLKIIRKNMKRLTEAQKRTAGTKLLEPMSHQEAVTSGDYYMFRETGSQELEMCNLENDSDELDDDDVKDHVFHSTSPNIGKLIETAIKSDMENAVKLAEEISQSEHEKNAIEDTSTLNRSFLVHEKSSNYQSLYMNEASPRRTFSPTPSSPLQTSIKSSPQVSVSSICTNPECTASSSVGKIEDSMKSPQISEDADNSPPSKNFGSRSLPPKDTLLVSIPLKQRRKSLDAASASAEPKTQPETPVPKVLRKPERSLCDICCAKRRRSFYYRVITLLKFIKACVVSAMISLSEFFNNVARDHKYVMKQLEEAKRVHRDEMLPESSTSLFILETRRDFSAFVRLLLSTHDLIMSSFNSICFLFVLLLQIQNPTIWVSPLTLMVLLWGSLSVPRPTKLFWQAIFTYTVVYCATTMHAEMDSVKRILFNLHVVFLVLFDSVFRSPLIDDSCNWVAGNNSLTVNPFFTVEKKENFSIYYLFILLTVLWQRSMLKNLGLWEIEESSRMKWRGNLIRLILISEFSFSISLLMQFHSLQKPWYSVKQFFMQLFFYTGDKIPVDVYTYMFLSEFVNIFVFIFGFASLTEKKEDGVSRYFYENRIPPLLLVIFVIQGLAMFLDRWIYLQRKLKVKIIFQYIQIVIVHMTLFVVFQGLTLSRIKTMIYPTVWYSVKFIYFLLSAYQIRNGYPSSVYGHALCGRYTIVNLYLYQGYLFMPFVYEFRTVTDWLWTETTLTLSEWLGMEDIFCTVFVLKCWRDYDNKYSYRRGVKISSIVKFLLGGGITFVFFAILLFPMAFFAFGHVTSEQNIPENMELSFRIGSIEPIYVGYSEEIRSFTYQQWYNFQTLYEHSPAAFTFLSEYFKDDVAVIRFTNSSDRNWIVPPVAFEQTIEQLREGRQKLHMTAAWKLHRRTEDQRRQTLVSGQNVVELSTNQTLNLLKVLLESEQGEHTVISPFMTTAFEINRYGSNIWWTATEYYDPLKKGLFDENNPNNDLIIYTFNNKIFLPGIFSYVSAQGILGMYTTFLVTIGFVIRRLCRNRVNQIFLDYIPNVDCVLQLLLDIYFVRENGERRLEEDLYAKLIFLFRSPETLIQWTRKLRQRKDSTVSDS